MNHERPFHITSLFAEAAEADALGGFPLLVTLLFPAQFGANVLSAVAD